MFADMYTRVLRRLRVSEAVEVTKKEQ